MKQSHWNRIFGMVLATAVSALAAGGTITGKAAFVGTAPKMKAIPMGADPVCETAHAGKPATSEWLLCGAKGELKNVFVYVKSGLGTQKFPAPATPVVLDQRGCTYSPHILGAQAGQSIDILNSDPTLHNIHALPKTAGNDAFNEAMPAARKKMTKKFIKSEVMVQLKCDVHPWMGAYVGVVDHPFFAVTDDKGSFAIPNLPPGTYTLEAWHEKLGTKTAAVTIKGTEVATASFEFTKPEKDAK